MIERIKEISNDWSKPWFPIRKKNFFPRNISGRRYSGGNTIMILIHMIFFPFRTPVFLTFKQAMELGLKVREGAFPVYHFAYMYFHHSTKEKISEKEYNELPPNQQDEYIKYPYAKYYNVFNLDLTDYEEKYPEEWDKLIDHYEYKPRLNEGEMFSYPFLDDIFDNQRWVCQMEFKLSDRAYYSPTEDAITVPLKQQFKEGEDFYTTGLHEMAHSTGIETRLKRKMGLRQTAEYAKEELVAELASALLCYFMGIESSIREDHAAYLKYWIEQLDAEPDFLMDVLSDVVKAVNYMMEKMNFVLPEEVNISQGVGKKENVPATSPVKEFEEISIID